MKYLEYDVKNMTISKSAGSKEELISGAVNYFGIKFNFDEEFGNIPGAKAVEFNKNRQTIRVDLVDGMCAVPNEILKDKQPFDMRVISGNIVGTKWQQVSIAESGAIAPEEPGEDAPDGTEYVKTLSGVYAIALIRASTNGLEYSTDGGETWNSGVSGVPEVPSKPKGAVYGRKNGDWVDLEQYLEENGGEVNAIEEVKVNGEALPIEDKSVNIDLSAYAKAEEVNALQTLTGTATQLSMLDYEETDTATIVAKINEIIGVLQSRGIATE